MKLVIYVVNIHW